MHNKCNNIVHIHGNDLLFPEIPSVNDILDTRELRIKLRKNHSQNILGRGGGGGSWNVWGEASPTG